MEWIARLVVAALPLALAACASSPKKSSSEALALPDRDRVHSSTLAHGGGRKKSPYAAAQEDLSKRGNYKAGGLYAPGVKDSTPDYIPDVDAIPEPEVVAEARSQFGNRSPYVVLGKTYKVLDSHDDYVETGTASYYGQKFHGRRTSNLEVYDMFAFTAAHKSLPLPSFARVTNLDNGKSVTVRVNDRGPFHDDRVIDLSYAAAVKLGITQRGTGRVEVRALHPGEAAPPVYASAANNPPPAPAPAKTPSAMDRLVSAMPIASANAGELPPGVRIATGKPAPMNAGAAAAPVKTTVATGKPAPVAAPEPVKTTVATGQPAPVKTTVATGQPAAALASTGKPGPHDYRFDMMQNGKSMTADEFDAWMKSRQVRVATGKAVAVAPPKPLTKAEKRALEKQQREQQKLLAKQQKDQQRALAEAEKAAKKAGQTAPATAVAAAADTRLPAPPAAPPPPTPAKAAAVVAANTPSAGDVTLQVASFSARGNADRALGMLRGAGIAAAKLLDGNAANGQKIWRLRVGPLQADAAPELAARIVGLGFGQPQRVRD
ncbi:septal ring lytic transglycosylase RlpA family protein [Lysobacter sp. K5869]|uniref:septal ring lytic transglycosylase RlpA family protein n=1 Tax=Lysobacter sp. K5869 TaxID=2820808 RepID=UPI001C06018C|nr:septal ring lytic transglycosylase RlpA family protein [Lysobacter sp. K5869]QWP79326.1 septal ring lytic transglycosylase RlpA family protein [Lysobacter sp. K5869]